MVALNSRVSKVDFPMNHPSGIVNSNHQPWEIDASMLADECSNRSCWCNLSAVAGGHGPWLLHVYSLAVGWDGAAWSQGYPVLALFEGGALLSIPWFTTHELETQLSAYRGSTIVFWQIGGALNRFEGWGPISTICYPLHRRSGSTLHGRHCAAAAVADESNG